MASNTHYVLGSKLSGSLSPELHRWCYAQLGIDATFECLETLDLPEAMQQFYAQKAGLMAVTHPYKIDIISYLYAMSPRAAEIGAVNTVFWRDNKLCGDNTDCVGIMAALQDKAPFESVLILGAGGAAAAMAWICKTERWPMAVWARDSEKAQAFATRWRGAVAPIEAVSRAQLVVNTLPVAAWQSSELLDMLPSMQATQVAFDMNYRPQWTPFLNHAHTGGGQCVFGLPMFVGQGLAQIMSWRSDIVCPDSFTQQLLSDLTPRCTHAIID